MLRGRSVRHARIELAIAEAVRVTAECLAIETYDAKSSKREASDLNRETLSGVAVFRTAAIPLCEPPIIRSGCRGRTDMQFLQFLLREPCLPFHQTAI